MCADALSPEDKAAGAWC